MPTFVEFVVEEARGNGPVLEVRGEDGGGGLEGVGWGQGFFKGRDPLGLR